MNEEQRRLLESRLQNYMGDVISQESIDPLAGDYRWGGRFPGGSAVSPLMKIPLYGMDNPDPAWHSGLLSSDPTRITIQNTPPPKRKGALRSFRELESDVGGAFFPYSNTMRIKKPGMLNYEVSLTPEEQMASGRHGRVGKKQLGGQWEKTMMHELRHGGFDYLKQNPSLIPDFSYVSRGPTHPQGPRRESAKGLIYDEPEDDRFSGAHKLIGAMSPNWTDRLIGGQGYKYPGAEELGGRVVQATGDEIIARQKIMEEINKSVGAAQKSFAEKKPKKKKYTRPR
jgi:hypothetical protein